MKTYRGLDTETPLGRLKVIATNTEAIEVSTFQDVLNFLSQRKFRGSVFMTFNLGFDAEHILKLTNDIDFLRKLYFEGAAPKGIDYNDSVKIRYIPTKFLRICFKKGKGSYSCVSMYDIAQFFSGWSLDRVARKYLGSYKNPISGEKLGSEPGYYERRKPEVLEYCRKDAELTLKAAMLMKHTIESAQMNKGKLSFRNPISQAKISEMYIHDNFKYPKIPEKVEFFHWLSEQAYHGGIFSTEKRGMFDRPLYSYDINSAYPFQMDKLPHWGNGAFEQVRSPDEIDTRYGWFLCKFNCSYISYPDYSHPYEVEFCYNEINPEHCETVLMNPRRVVYPSGERKQWITKIEYEWLLKHNYNVEFHGGVAWQQTKEEYESPFSWIKDVYYARQAIKSKDSEDITQWALKIAMNGAYGKTAQKRKGIGALTNFFYASYITAGTRVQISDVMIAYPENVIEIATDSILLDKKIGGEKYEKERRMGNKSTEFKGHSEANTERKENRTPPQYKSRGRWRGKCNNGKSQRARDFSCKLDEIRERNEYQTRNNIRTIENNPETELTVSNKLGEWSYARYEKALIIGSGIRQQWNKDGSFVTHARGLTYKSDWNMIKEIKEGYNEKEEMPNIDCDYLYFEKTRPLHLGEVLFHHKLLSIKDLGVFTKVSKRLQVNTDKKRRWEREYKNFRDILTSEPMDSEPLRLGEDV